MHTILIVAAFLLVGLEGVFENMKVRPRVKLGWFGLAAFFLSIILMGVNLRAILGS